jgi:regulator of sigma E protease
LDLLYTITVTIIALGVLIAFHEFGHFWVARKCGVKVLRFSIGFGTPLLRWRDKLDTEYVIAAIPLGGYVRMLDEREDEVTPGMEHLAFNRKPVLQRIAVVAAGPLANLLLAVVAYWFVFLLERIGDSGRLTFSVRYPESDVVYQSEAVLENWLSDVEEPNLIAGLGIRMYRPPVPVVLDEIVPDSPAAAAGLRSGDLIVSADGAPMAQWMDWVDHVRERPGQEISIEFERDGLLQRGSITPAKITDDSGQSYGQVGVSVQVPEWPDHMLREFHYGPIAALGAATRRTGDLVVFTLKSIKKMIMGLISPKNLSGPITIAKVASASAQSGPEAFIAFLALLSVSLGVLNLLPIPVLDGGHLLYYTFELLVGKPVPLKVQMLGYQVGLFIILGVMVLALYNDFTRL